MYADFECNVKRIRNSYRGYNTSYNEKDQDHVPCSFASKILSVDDKFSKPVVFYRGRKKAIIDLLKQFLKSMIIARK